MTGEAAEAWAGADGDFYIRDLQENIAAGNFPSWDLHVQVMPYEDAKTYRFNRSISPRSGRTGTTH